MSMYPVYQLDQYHPDTNTWEIVPRTEASNRPHHYDTLMSLMGLLVKAHTAVGLYAAFRVTQDGRTCDSAQTKEDQPCGRYE